MVVGEEAGRGHEAAAEQRETAKQVLGERVRGGHEVGRETAGVRRQTSSSPSRTTSSAPITLWK